MLQDRSDHPQQSQLRAKFFDSDAFKSLDFHQVDSKEDDWKKNGFKRLIRFLEDAIDVLEREEELPKNWGNLRQELRNLQAKGEKTLSLQAYEKMASQLGIEHPLDRLTNWLVPSGVVFYRKGLFHDAIILDQAWAIRAIYTLFDRDQGYCFKIENQKGRFTGKNLVRIWRGHNQEERELFLSFMLSCEICFEIETGQKEDRKTFEERLFIAPQLLPVDPPPSIEVTKKHFNKYEKNMLYIQYRHEFLHFGIIQSFIFRTQYLAEVNDIWRNGILILEDGVYALIEVKEKTIQVQVPAEGKS